MTERRPRHLLDVNLLVALLDEDHVHHRAALAWFSTPNLQWALCPFTEAGLLRYMTRPSLGALSVEEAAAMVERLAARPGYHYQPIATGWAALTAPFRQRLFGYRQITDAYLLGVAIQTGLVVATFDRAFLHLAGEHRRHVLVLSPA